MTPSPYGGGVAWIKLGSTSTNHCHSCVWYFVIFARAVDIVAARRPAPPAALPGPAAERENVECLRPGQWSRGAVEEGAG